MDLPEVKHRKFFPALITALGGESPLAAEVGVLEGSFSTWLLNKTPGLVLYSIDAWTDMDGEPMEETFTKCANSLSPFGTRSIMKKGFSDAMCQEFDDGMFDFVYIDADHRYEMVLKDLALWLPKVRSGGVLAGHDYSGRGKGITKAVATVKNPKRGHKGVRRAVNEFVEEMGLELRTTSEPCPSWWIICP